MNMKKLLFALVLLLPGFVFGQEINQIQKGKGTYPVNLVIVPDGSRAGIELDVDFPKRAKTTWDSLRAVTPYNIYGDSFNVFTIKVASEESGITYINTNGEDKKKNTYFQSYYDGSTRRILLEDEGMERLFDLRPRIPGGYDVEKDLTLIIVNDPVWGGTGSSDGIAFTTAHPLAYLITRHELGGHAATKKKVEDEYPEAVSWFLTYLPFPEKEILNVTMKTPEQLVNITKAGVKWPTTPGAHFPEEWKPENIGKVSLFPIDLTKVTNFFIGTMRCIMRSAIVDHFCPVCINIIIDAIDQRLAIPRFLLADFNRDGIVDLDDFFLFASAFGSKKGIGLYNPAFDLNHDGVVDYDDFFLFAADFGKALDGYRLAGHKPVVTVVKSRRIGCRGFLPPTLSSPDPELQRLNYKPAVDDSCRLSQNYPNPFNSSTQISYDLPANGHVRLSVYNITGQRIMTLVDETQDKGHYVIRWDGRDSSGRRVASGMYVYRLEAGDFSEIRRMIFLK